jgi:anti-sigma factor RsiW
MMEPCRNGKCSSEDLVLLYYGDLDEEARCGVEAHLAGCQSCRAELADIERTLGLLPQASIQLTDPEIQRFAARVSARAIRRRQGFAPAIGGALAAAAVLVVTFFSLQPGGKAPSAVHTAKVSHVAEIDVVRNLDLLQNLDLIENLDTLQALEGHG